MNPPVLTDRLLSEPVVLTVVGPDDASYFKWAGIFADGRIAICTGNRPNWFRRVLQWFVFGHRWYSLDELRKAKNDKETP